MEQRLEKIRLKISRLQELYQQKAAEVDELRASNFALQKKLMECEDNSANLAKRNLIDGMAHFAARDEVEIKRMKLKINELVREVDKCIALLNQ